MTEPRDELGVALRNHPLRASLSEEMHARKLPAFPAPTRLMQVVTLLGDTTAAENHDKVAALCMKYGGAAPTNSRHFVRLLGEVYLVWELHSEAISCTLIRIGFEDPQFGLAPFGQLAHDLIDLIPGEIVRATQIALIPASSATELRDRLCLHFTPDDMIVCDVARGKARIWSDYRLHADGFGRLLIVDNGLRGYEPAQLVQRLQELGNYRNLALLGLPVAQALSAAVGDLERRLAILTANVAARTSDDGLLLDELSYLSAELARMLAETRYRMSATKAYGQISIDRVDSLMINSVAGYPNLADFTDRRLLPAIRTCESFSQRLEDLSQRVAWTSSLLRTRVDTALGRQNRDLLDSMDRRTRMQLRLQQAVEGLSAVAISYYLVAMLAYVLKSAHAFSATFDPDLMIGIAVPLIAFVMIIVTRRFRRSVEEVERSDHR